MSFKFSSRIANDHVWKTIDAKPLFYEGVPDVLSCLIATKYRGYLLLGDSPTD